MLDGQRRQKIREEKRWIIGLASDTSSCEASPTKILFGVLFR